MYGVWKYCAYDSIKIKYLYYKIITHPTQHTFFSADYTLQYKKYFHEKLISNFMKNLLISTHHEPKKDLMHMYSACIPVMMDIYDDIFINVTPNTHPDVIKTLTNNGIKVYVSKTFAREKNHIKAFEAYKKYPEKTVHYLDFDRVLHWSVFFEKELRDINKRIYAILEKNKNIYINVARTEKAYATHQDSLLYGEKPSNYIISKIVGDKKINDWFGFSFAIKQKNLNAITSRLRGKEGEFYGEFPVLAKKLRLQIQHMLCEGLEIETFDRQEFHALTLREKHAKLNTNEAWLNRMKLNEETIKGALRHVKIEI